MREPTRVLSVLALGVEQANRFLTAQQRQDVALPLGAARAACSTGR